MNDEETTEDAGGSFDDWQSVAAVGQMYEAELIALRLQEAGIEAQVIDQSFEQVPLSNVSNFEKVRVLVPIARVDEARRLLDQKVELPDDAEVPAGEPEVASVAADEPAKE
jgi:hypothetical protein